MKYFTLLSFTLLSLISMAQNYSLTIFNNNGQQFFAILNGIRQNSLPQTNLKISGMTAGSYELKLIFADGKTGDINKKFWLDESGDYLVRVVFKKGKGKLQYFGVTNQGMPGGGTNVEYRPNDQSVYSDGSTTSTGTQQNGVSGQTQGSMNGGNNGSTTYPNNSGNSGTVQQGGTNGQTTYQNGTGQATGTYNGGSATGTVNQTGTGNVGMTTSTSVSDPSMNGTGNVGMTTTTTVTDPTMNGTGSMGTTTTVSDPTINGGSGNFGMSTSTTVTDPNMNGGNGNFGTTTTVKDPVTGETININVNMNMSDPNLNGGMGTYGTTTTVSGTPNGQMTTSSSGSMQSTTTTSTTVNGSTTTTTTTQNETWGNGQTGTVTGTTTNNWGTQTTGTAQTPNKGGYTCTEVLVDMVTVQNKLNSFTFDDDKQLYVQKDLAKYCMTTDQAMQILKAFTFEEDRLDIAKSLYPRLTDKANASKINSLFTFDASKEEFQEFIQSH